MLRTAAGRLRCILRGVGIAPSMQVSAPTLSAMHSAAFTHTGTLALKAWSRSAFSCP